MIACQFDNERTLKRILNKPGLEMNSSTVIIPDTLPAPIFYKLNPDSVTQTALRQRMEMLELELQIALANPDNLPPRVFSINGNRSYPAFVRELKQNVLLTANLGQSLFQIFLILFLQLRVTWTTVDLT